MSVNIFPTLAGSQMEVERTPYYGTVIQTEASGRELTLTQQVAPRYRYRISYDFLRQDGTTDEAATLLSFLAAMRGSYEPFLFLDPYDSTVTAQEFGVGDAAATVFQLQRHAGGTWTDVLGTWPAYTTTRTNSLRYSADLTNGTYWPNTGSDESGNAVMAPDGSGYYADKLRETAVTSSHCVSQQVTVGTATYTFSVYAKAGERTAFEMEMSSNSARFNLSTGAVDSSAGVTAAISSVGNSWYRCSITCALTTGNVDFYLRLYNSGSTYLGTATYGAYFWGAQLETGSTATRYIATTTDPVVQHPTWWSTGGGEGWEPIYAPAWASVSVTGTAITWTPGTAGGIVFATPPVSGAALAWSGTFYRRVRLASDSLQTRRRTSRIWSGEVELVSVIG